MILERLSEQDIGIQPVNINPGFRAAYLRSHEAKAVETAKQEKKLP